MKILGIDFSAKKLSYINPKIELKKLSNKERGCFAMRHIKVGEILTVSAGIGLPKGNVRKLPRAVQKYCYYMENNFFYCPLSVNNLSIEWYMNHSCGPNSWGGRGWSAFTIYALRDIKTGEEITYDYTRDYNGEYEPFRKFICKCGAKKCLKIIRY